ncbi:MAG: VanZ family protein [Actinobacteria bacterium]|nr:VanZ family protein [Actinomycetota bacterium]
MTVTRRWLAPAAVYAAILAASSVPGDSLAGPAWLSLFGHLVEYAVLGAALVWAARGAWTPPALVALAGFPLALLDELYQHAFGSGRVFELRDLVVDGIGLTLGAVVSRWILRRARDG